MKLIAISPNVLVNPDCISSIEQRPVGNTTVTFVYVWDREYVLAVPLEEFYKNLGIGDLNGGGQYFAG